MNKPKASHPQRRRRMGAGVLAVLLLTGALVAGAVPVKAEAPDTVKPAAGDATTAISLQTLSGTNGIPGGVLLPVSNILQNPELPNGCEATSLAILLNYLGFSANKTELATDYIETQAPVAEDGVLYGPNPETVYPGNPADGSGYYILTTGLANAANRYLGAQGSALEATDLTGASEADLIALLEQGDPVVLWSTMDYGPARYTAHSWTLADTGEAYTPYANLHCMVLVGYDEATFTLCDPLNAELQTLSRDTFMAGYNALGARAMAIL